ncbi:CBO0543 family protein [Bacillus sp. UNC438CL73TsuS30]|uniref:CBO0543 family protein n=1 Tax=Bacillus sp. UNC438CL73TsuS30 TaxID=1340434 RepID=UPI00047D795E|nr:CBO0543 family protein [Bacillus sp. UNC438CL73TsuS30]
MNTVKHLNGSSLPPLRKKRYLFWIKTYIPAMLLGSLLGTYLNLYFVEKQMYRFPIRPYPEFFSINIVFTLVVLPVFIFVFLYMMKKVNGWGKAGIVLFLSLFMPIMEKLSEMVGMFAHSSEWKHLYAAGGYLIFLTVIYSFFHWMENKNKSQD